MSTKMYRKFEEDFKAGAVRIVEETGKPIAQVARELGVNEGTLGNWVAAARRARDGENPPLTQTERAELIAFRFKSPHALIVLAMLSLGGHKPPLPGRN